MTTAIETLVAKWAEPDGVPFKGELITDDNCMCAQGQVLHFIGGWDFDRLRSVEQAEADKVTAELLGISRAHAVLLRQVNDSQFGAPSVVLTDPAKVLGDQAHIILAFWRHLDRMTPDQWRAAGDAAAAVAAARVAGDAAAAAAAARVAAVAAAWAADAAKAAVGAAAWDAVMDAAMAAAVGWAATARPTRAGAAARDAAWAAARASNEIQGAAIMRERGQPFYFLPMFGFANPEAVLAAQEAQ